MLVGRESDGVVKVLTLVVLGVALGFPWLAWRWYLAVGVGAGSVAAVLVASLVVAALLVVLFVRRSGGSPRQPRVVATIEEKYREALGLGAALVGFVTIGGFNVFVRFGSSGEASGSGPSGAHALFESLLDAFASPVREEVLFRGVVFVWLARLVERRGGGPVLSFVVAGGVSSVAFALSHVLVAADLSALLATAFPGLVFAAVYVVSGRLSWAVFCHVLVNASTALSAVPHVGLVLLGCLVAARSYVAEAAS